MATILVVEDEQSIRENICQFLELEAFQVLEAEDGVQGMQTASEQHPDLVICDVAMPNMDGYQLLLAIRQQPAISATPFIFLTARADRSFMRHGMELGADDYLTKPFTHAELLAAVRSRLDRHSTMVDAGNRALDDARVKLTHMITHELRTPLVSLITGQELMLRQVGQLSPGELQEMLHTLRLGSQRLRHVVEQLVFTAQIDLDVLNEADIQERGMVIGLWEVMTAAINTARGFAYRNRDAYIRFAERDRDAAVLCHIDALKHALAELVTNALNFSPSNGDIAVSQWEADGRVWISITDQGPGISSDQLESAKQAFRQIDRERQEQQGLGLGLPLSEKIIRMHGGALELSSVVGKGTQVVVNLPLTAEALPDQSV